MTHPIDRRSLLAVAGLALLPPTAVCAADPKKLALTLAPRDLTLRPGMPATAAWRFVGEDAPRFTQGDEVEVTIANALPVAVLIHWRGLDGAAALEPVLGRGPIAAAGSGTYRLKLTHAGTLICDAGLGGDAAPHALPVLALIVAERTPPDVDRDVVLTLEEWRPSASKPELTVTQPVWTVNGSRGAVIEAKSQDRLRLRLINASQRTVVAIELADLEVRIIAIDGQPSEPFLARDRRVVMAPGTRLDAVVEVGGAGQHAMTLLDGERSHLLSTITVAETPKDTQQRNPVVLSANGLPEKLPLQQALRVDVSLNPDAGWLLPAAMTANTPPAFRVKRGRTVVLALSNPSDKTAVFHLHGHHVRLLDRLDDGWKPFWLDTVAVAAKQTVRIAFGAEHAGAFLMEAIGATATGQRRLQSYRVDA